jgi:excisionase family DNA binding protein
MSTYITTTEAATILDVTTRQVTKLIQQGKLKAIRFGGKVWLVDKASVMEYKEKRGKENDY